MIYKWCRFVDSRTVQYQTELKTRPDYPIESQTDVLFCAVEPHSTFYFIVIDL